MTGRVLAIGDGGNDVGMIEEAHIGVGIQWPSLCYDLVLFDQSC